MARGTICPHLTNFTIGLIHKIGNQVAYSDVQIRQYDVVEIVKSLRVVLTWSIRLYTKTDGVKLGYYNFAKSLVDSIGTKHPKTKGKSKNRF